MSFSLPLDTAPMEARSAEELPAGLGWQFEPKWDGFRCLAFRGGNSAELMGKSGKSLARYFPDMMTALASIGEDVVLDGELVIPVAGHLSFAALQDRLHPAASRVGKLATETPALLILFDCLATGEASLLDAPLPVRRAALEATYARLRPGAFRLSPFTPDRQTAQAWLARAGCALDGVIAKPSGIYRPGRREMLKVKRLRTADCAVGGFRYGRGTRQVGSLLLGLHDEAGLLHHVGFTSAIADADRAVLTRRLEALIAPPGFTGDAPGGPSRWSTPETTAWEPLRPELVVEVRYDQVTGNRFRHGTGLLRWRPDKAPRQCGFDQLRTEAAPDRMIASVLDASGN